MPSVCESPIFLPRNSLKLLGLAEKIEVEEIIDIHVVIFILDHVKNIETTSIFDS